MTRSLSVEINTNVAMDIELLTNGGFSPIHTFMDFETLESILNNMRIQTGEAWPIPILLPKTFDNLISDLDRVVLKFQGKEFAILEEPNEFVYNLDKMVKLLYGTDDQEHTGVYNTKKSSNTFITGKLQQIESLSTFLDIKYLNPLEAKEIFKDKGWKKIVGFHTRNPPHRGHEFIHSKVLETHDGLLLHPVIGTKKKGDFTTQAIMKSYELYVEKFLPKEKIVLTPLLTYSRYAGPREAIFTAIVRKNFGCTSFVVGRDHTGFKNFYGKYDSQKIFERFKDIGIEIIPFSEPFYCNKSKQITTKELCIYGDKYYVEISGTKIREAIKNKLEISEIFIRKEILEVLQNTENVFIN